MYLVAGVPFFLNNQIFILMCIFPKMLRHGRCFGVDDVSSRSMIRRGQCFDAVDVSAWSMFRCGQCFGAVDALARSILQQGQNYFC